MNLQNVMAQANKLKAEMERLSSEIEATTYKGKNSGVEVEINGKSEVLSIKILNDEALSDKELVEDMILLAINDAFDNLKKDKEEKLGKYTNGLGGLF